MVEIGIGPSPVKKARERIHIPFVLHFTQPTIGGFQENFLIIGAL